MVMLQSVLSGLMTCCSVAANIILLDGTVRGVRTCLMTGPGQEGQEKTPGNVKVCQRLHMNNH